MIPFTFEKIIKQVTSYIDSKKIHSNTFETQNLEPMLNPAHYLVVSLISTLENLEYEAQANDGDKSKYLRVIF